MWLNCTSNDSKYQNPQTQHVVSSKLYWRDQMFLPGDHTKPLNVTWMAPEPDFGSALFILSDIPVFLTSSYCVSLCSVSPSSHLLSHFISLLSAHHTHTSCRLISATESGAHFEISQEQGWRVCLWSVLVFEQFFFFFFFSRGSRFVCRSSKC